MKNHSEHQLTRLIDLLEEARIILSRAALTAEDLSKALRGELNDEWKRTDPANSDTPQVQRPSGGA